MNILNIFQGDNLVSLIKTVGMLGLFGIVFSETGLFVGFFLPGDSLLFTAGFLASQGVFSVVALAVICFVAAVLGDSTGYAFGKKVGPKIFSREDSFLFKKEYIKRAQEFYDRHGAKTIVMARFVPVVRTFAPIVAGVGEMKYATFITYNIIGGVLWAFAMTFAGFFQGSLIPNIDNYILPIAIAIIVVSFLPTLFEIYKSRKKTTTVSKS